MRGATRLSRLGDDRLRRTPWPLDAGGRQVEPLRVLAGASASSRSSQSEVAIAWRMTSTQRRGTPRLVAVVVGRDQLLLEQSIQVLGVRPVLGRFVGFCLAPPIAQPLSPS
jgi:hypothetical protein